MRRDVFRAIADPNRRAILILLANQRLTLNGVAEKFSISRPAVSRHVKILAECGLVRIRRQGRERYCEARLDQLNEVADWVRRYKETRKARPGSPDRSREIFGSTGPQSSSWWIQASFGG